MSKPVLDLTSSAPNSEKGGESFAMLLALSMELRGYATDNSSRHSKRGDRHRGTKNKNVRRNSSKDRSMTGSKSKSDSKKSIECSVADRGTDDEGSRSIIGSAADFTADDEGCDD